MLDVTRKCSMFWPKIKVSSLIVLNKKNLLKLCLFIFVT